MTLMAITIAATFWLGTPNWEVNVSPTILAEVNFLPRDMAVALPHLVLAQHSMLVPGWTRFPKQLPDAAWVYEHELQHVRHWEHLGPAFPIAYAATLGRAFEDYLQPDPWRGTDLNCPLLRLSNRSLSVLPCYQKGSN